MLPSGALKTLSYVAYEEPVTSKRLVQIRGSQVYVHIKVLEQMQFVEHENLGRLKVYRTTPKFQNYFGITDLNEVKRKLSDHDGYQHYCCRHNKVKQADTAAPYH